MTVTGELLTAALTIFAGSFAAVAAVRTIALQRQWLDYPNSRSSHTIVTPRGGGLAILAVAEAALMILLTRNEALTLDWVAVLSAGIIVAAVSWIDDLRRLSNRVRFSIHVAAGGTVLVALARDHGGMFSHRATLWGEVATAALALVWIVGLTNAYNFMDGIDLMAAGQSIAAGIGWAVLGTIAGSTDFVLIGVVIASAAAGFAIHNRPPARIFMGDVGSAFLGYLLGTITVVGAHRDPLLGISGALLVWPFVFDASFTFLRRMWNREPVFEAHRSHLYQRLVIAGKSHLQVSLLYFALDWIGLGCGVALMASLPGAPWISAMAIAASALGLWTLVTQTEKTAATQV